MKIANIVKYHYHRFKLSQVVHAIGTAREDIKYFEEEGNYAMTRALHSYIGKLLDEKQQLEDRIAELKYSKDRNWRV